MTQMLALLLLLVGIATAKLKPISTYFDVCHRNQSNEILAQCMQKSIEKSRPLLIKGIPELQLLPLDPLKIDKIDMKQNSSQLQFSGSLSDIKIYGLGGLALKNMKINLEELSWNFTTSTPNVRLEGTYVMDGKVMGLPVNGSGHASVNLTEVTSTYTITFKKVKKNNKIHLKIDSFQQQNEPKGAHINLSNLFGGNKRLGAATNAFLNENWYEAYKKFYRHQEEMFNEFFKNKVEQIVLRYSFDELFPE